MGRAALAALSASTAQRIGCSRTAAPQPPHLDFHSHLCVASRHPDHRESCRARVQLFLHRMCGASVQGAWTSRTLVLTSDNVQFTHRQLPQHRTDRIFDFCLWLDSTQIWPTLVDRNSLLHVSRPRTWTVSANPCVSDFPCPKTYPAHTPAQKLQRESNCHHDSEDTLIDFTSPLLVFWISKGTDPNNLRSHLNACQLRARLLGAYCANRSVADLLSRKISTLP